MATDADRGSTTDTSSTSKASPFPISLTVVIPAYNEEASVQQVAKDYRLVCAVCPWISDYKVIVVDNVSIDETVYEAWRGVGKHGFVVECAYPGYGNAVKLGVSCARTDWVCITDADGTYNHWALPELTLATKDADMVVARRYTWISGDSTIHRVARWFLVRWARWVVGAPIQDLNSGLRVFRRDFFHSVEDYLSDGFSLSSSLTVMAHRRGLRVSYTPILYRPRIGKSKVSRVSGFFGIMWKVVRLRYGKA